MMWRCGSGCLSQRARRNSADDIQLARRMEIGYGVCFGDVWMDEIYC